MNRSEDSGTQRGSSYRDEGQEKPGAERGGGGQKALRLEAETWYGGIPQRGGGGWKKKKNQGLRRKLQHADT